MMPIAHILLAQAQAADAAADALGVGVPVGGALAIAMVVNRAIDKIAEAVRDSRNRPAAETEAQAKQETRGQIQQLTETSAKIAEALARVSEIQQRMLAELENFRRQDEREHNHLAQLVSRGAA